MTTPLRHLAAVLALVSLLGLASHAATRKASAPKTAAPFAVVMNPKATPADLKKAIAALKLPAKEPPQVWSRIANDSHYPAFHRRAAIYQLFKRHAHANMPLADFARLLDHPTWLHSGDFSEVTALFGWIPVLGSPGRVFWFSVPRDSGGRDEWAVYVRVLGRVHLEDFRAVMLGGRYPAAVGKATVAEIGFVESLDPWQSWSTRLQLAPRPPSTRHRP